MLSKIVLFLLGKAAGFRELVVVNGFVCAWQAVGIQRIYDELINVLTFLLMTIKYTVTSPEVWLSNFLLPQYVIATVLSSLISYKHFLSHDFHTFKSQFLLLDQNELFVCLFLTFGKVFYHSV